MCVCGEFEFTHSCHALGASREPRLAPSRARLISQTRGARLPFRGVEAPKTHCLRKEAAAHTATQLMAPCKHCRCPSLALPTSPLPRQPIKACCAYLLGMFFFRYLRIDPPELPMRQSLCPFIPPPAYVFLPTTLPFISPHPTLPTVKQKHLPNRVTIVHLCSVSAAKNHLGRSFHLLTSSLHIPPFSSFPSPLNRTLWATVATLEHRAVANKALPPRPDRAGRK